MGFSANVEKIKPSATMAVSALAKKLKAEGRDVIDLSAGEPDFESPIRFGLAAAVVSVGHNEIPADPS